MIKKASALILFLLLSWQGSLPAEEKLSWQDCLAVARKNNPQLISAVEAVNQRKSGLDLTSSSFYPQISGQLGFSRTKTGSTEADSYSYGLSGSQLVFDGLKTFHEVSAARENLKAAQENYRFVSSDVRFALRGAFIDLLSAQELVGVTEEIVKIRRGSLELITLRYHSGLEHKGALLTADANMEAANFELSRARREVVTAREALSKAMGRKENVLFAVKGDFMLAENLDVRPDFEKLAKTHPAVLAAAARKNAAAFTVRSSRANFYPEVSGSGSTGKSGSDWPPQADTWRLGVSLDMPVFEGGLKTAQLKTAQAAYNQSMADEVTTLDNARFNLTQYWAALQDGWEQVSVQRKSLLAAEERSQIAEAQYSIGFISFDTWIIIQNDLVNAKKTYLAAQANAVRAEAQWVQAKGETIEYAQ